MARARARITYQLVANEPIVFRGRFAVPVHAVLQHAVAPPVRHNFTLSGGRKRTSGRETKEKEKEKERTMKRRKHVDGKLKRRQA